MSNDHVWEKFYTAVRGMAVSPKPIEMRVADAFASISVLRPEEFGEGLEEVASEWSAYEAQSANMSFAKWAEGLSEPELVEIASWIVDTADRIEEDRG